MTKKKFSGHKMEAKELGIRVAGKYDEQREIYSDDDSILAHYLKKHLNNDIQEKILTYIGETNVKYEEDYDDEIESYECYFDDDFVLNHHEIIVDEYKNNYYEVDNIYD